MSEPAAGDDTDWASYAGAGENRRFNAPPGWPVPPSGWTPPRGWEPDPAWPTPPAGWQFWVPVGYPARRRLRPRLSLAIKVLAGVITLAATIVGTVVAISDRPQPYTNQDWARKANAVCEKDFGSMQTTMLALLPQLFLTLQQMQASGLTGLDTTNLVKGLGDLAAAFRSVTGDLRAIDLPEELDRAELQRLLGHGGDAAAELGSMGLFFVNMQIGQASPADAQAVAATTQKFTATSLPAWSASATALGLNQCALTSAGPSGGPTASPLFAAAETALVDDLAPTALSGCLPNRAVESATIVAAVTCVATTSPVALAKRPLVVRFSDDDALNAWLASATVGGTGKTCADGDYRHTWFRTSDSTTIGTLICFATSEGFRALWSLDDLRMAVIIDGADASSTYSWWSAHAYLVRGTT